MGLKEPEADFCSVTEAVALGYGNALKDEAAVFTELPPEL